MIRDLAAIPSPVPEPAKYAALLYLFSTERKNTLIALLFPTQRYNILNYLLFSRQRKKQREYSALPSSTLLYIEIQ